MGTITIYRFTDVTDDTSTAEKLEFNTSADTTTINGIITEVKVDPVEGVGDNQGAEQNYGDLQSMGSVEKVYTLTGFISQRSNASNTFLETLDDWQEQSKTSKGVFSQGRFGFADADDDTDDVTPVPNSGNTPQGLIWQSLSKTSDMEGDRTLFVLKFRFSIGDAT